jgi:phospholipid/cholesterol/gamma-HCH transport system substrate-binding protein
MVKASNELKTGIVIVVAVALLAGILYRTGDLSFGKRGYTVKTRFETIQGLKKFAPVRLSGLEVGEIRRLDTVYEPERTLVEAELWVQEGTKLRADSLAVVSTLGLMGEKYVEIHAGASPEFVKAGALIGSKETVSMDDVMENAQLTLTDFRRFINNLDGVVGENRGKVGRIVDNLEETTEYFKEFAEDVKYHPWKVLAKGKEKTPEEIAELRAERKARKAAEAAAGSAPPPAASRQDGSVRAGGAADAPAGKPNFAAKRPAR